MPDLLTRDGFRITGWSANFMGQGSMVAICEAIDHRNREETHLYSARNSTSTPNER